MDHASFGRLLRDRRTKSGLSLRRLAQLSSVHQGTLSHAEQGQRRGLSEQSARDVDATLSADGQIVRAWRTLPNRDERRSSPVPNQLPAAPVLFGRDTLLDTIIDRGTNPLAEQAGPTVLLLTGPGGVGKTALAICAAHRLAERLGTGVLINDMQGWDEHSQPRTSWDVLHRWARALGAPASEAGGDHDDLVALWRALTAGRRLVAVIDNAQPDQVDDLVPASPGSVILVTSRERMINTAVPLERLSVPPLSQHDALDVLSLHSGFAHHVVQPLADRCAGLPLALRVAGEDAGAHWMPEEIPEMAANWDDLPHHSAIDRATALSYRTLTTEAAHAWRLLAHLGGNPSLEAAAAALHLGTTATRTLLHEATRANLLDRDAGFYSYHNLHRDYALRVSRDEDTSAEVSEAVYRALTWYLHGLAAADTWFAARNDLPEIVSLPEGITPPAFASYDEAFEWVDFRWSSLYSAVDTAASHGWAALAWQLSALHVHWAFLVKPWHRWSGACRIADDAAREAGELNGQAWMQHILGSIAGDQDHYSAAISHTDAALQIRRHLGSPRDIGWAAVNAVRWRLATEAHANEINPLIDEIIESHESVGMQAGVCLGHCFRGTLVARRDADEAIGHLNQALVGIDDLADPAVYCYIHTTLAEIELQAGRLLDAREHAEHSDAYARRSGADWFRIGALSIAAETYPTGDPRLWETLHLAVTMADKLGDPREPSLRDRLDRLDS